MRVVVCGSRRWTDARRIRQVLQALPSGTEIVHGDAPGADRIAGRIAGELGFSVRAIPAEWGRYGKAAGPIRNARMLKEFGPIDLVLAFHDDFFRSKGTKDMVRQAILCRVPVRIVGRAREVDDDTGWQGALDRGRI
jgi:hypothetical protein